MVRNQKKPPGDRDMACSDSTISMYSMGVGIDNIMQNRSGFEPHSLKFILETVIVRALDTTCATVCDTAAGRGN